MFAVALAVAAPAVAETPDPFAAWNAGDFAHAVEYARPQAQSGDADAQYLLGEAYRLGRGVTADPVTAIGWYRRAAAQSHVRAADSLGLLLFAQGQRADAMPLLVQSADRGEPRALYLVATAHFNGDYVAKDWPLAYAMMTRAADAGIAQARQSLTTMDRYLTPTDKAKAQTLIDAQRKAPPPAATTPMRTAAATPPPAATKAAKSVKPAPPPPAPVRVAAASTPPPSVPPAPAKTAAMTAPAPQSGATTKPAAPASEHASGTWRAQIGAFGSTDRAEAAWTTLTRKHADLAGLDHQVAEAGSIRRLQVTGIASRDAANALCRKIIAAGSGCIPIVPAK